MRRARPGAGCRDRISVRSGSGVDLDAVRIDESNGVFTDTEPGLDFVSVRPAVHSLIGLTTD